jgi:Protein kinase domain
MFEFEPGTVFAGHRIDEMAGRGGMGVVYRAVQLQLNRAVAIKVIAPALMDDSDIRRRFMRESRLAASIEHPNVIPIHYVGDEDGVAYIAMRYVPGDDLRTLVRREGGLPPARAARIVAQVGAALDAAHAAGLVHRDVKPANVLLGPADHAYLTDFGLTTDLESSGATSTGRWVGTLDYVAPEQIRGERVDARTDVYSLGAVLFFTLTRRVPFVHDGDEAKLWAHLNEPPPTPSTWGAPEAFDAVVARAMAKAPEDRYPSAGDLGRAAEAAVTGRRVTTAERMVAAGSAAPAAAESATATTRRDPSDAPTRPAATAATVPAERRSHRGLAGAAIVIVLVGAAAVAYEATRDGGGEPRPAAQPSPTPTPERGEPQVVRDLETRQRRPSSIALAGGRIWVGSLHRPGLMWMDQRGGRRLRPRPDTRGIRHIEAVGRSLWVTTIATWSLIELDARTGEALREPVPLPGRPAALAADRNTVWVGIEEAAPGQPAMLMSVDADTGAVRAIKSLSHSVFALELARGSLWLAAGTPARLLEIDRASGAVERTIAMPGELPVRVAFGAGALWVTLNDHEAVVRVDPKTGSRATITVGARPLGVAVRGSSVWVANVGTSTVTRIDARTARVAAELEVPLNPYAVVADRRGAWVTAVGTNRLLRIRG